MLRLLNRLILKIHLNESLISLIAKDSLITNKMLILTRKRAKNSFLKQLLPQKRNLNQPNKKLLNNSPRKNPLTTGT